MARIYKSAMGKSIDMDMLRLANEEVIAVGNMGTNARGDELGKGGRIVKSRNQLMTDYHKLNTPVAQDDAPAISATPISVPKLKTPVAQDTAPVATNPTVTTQASPTTAKLRGSLAGAVASKTTAQSATGATNNVAATTQADKIVTGNQPIPPGSTPDVALDDEFDLPAEELTTSSIKRI